VEKLDVTNIIPEYNASQSGIGYDGLTRSELLSVIRQLQKEVTYLNERCNQYRVTISELEDALAKTSFIPAVEMPETVSQSSPSKNDEVSPTDHFNNVSQQPIQPRTLLSECPQCTKYAIQIQELMDDAKTKGVVASDELEFEFSMHFEDVRRYMVPIFEIYKGFGEVWFHGMLDIRTRKVTSVSTVRWIDSSQNDQDES